MYLQKLLPFRFCKCSFEVYSCRTSHLSLSTFPYRCLNLSNQYPQRIIYYTTAVSALQIVPIIYMVLYIWWSELPEKFSYMPLPPIMRMNLNFPREMDKTHKAQTLTHQPHFLSYLYIIKEFLVPSDNKILSSMWISRKSSRCGFHESCQQLGSFP